MESSDSDRQGYVEKLYLFARILPAILDHLSDLPILFTLWYEGYAKLFWLGIAIDLLPGPAAAYQFYILGFRKEMLFLLCHPLNIFLYTLLAMCTTSDKIETFSRKVIAYIHESQALLESPLQVIFTVTLVCHGILPTPWDDSFVWRNSLGTEINLAFFPALSVVFSLTSILLNASGTVNLFDNLKTNRKRALSWMVFLISNVAFRLQAWILLCTFLAEFAGVVAILMLLINLVILLFTQHKIKIDPVLSALYSLTFPIAFMRSIHEGRKIEEEFAFVKQIHTTLAAAGTCLLLISLWTAYYLLPLMDVSRIIIPRDLLLFFMLSTSALGLLSLISTLLIRMPGLKNLCGSPRKSEKSTVNRDTRSLGVKCAHAVLKVAAFAIRTVLLAFAFLAICLPMVWTRQQVQVQFSVEICGHQEAFFGYGYYRQNVNMTGSLGSCPAHLTPHKNDIGDKLELLACLVSQEGNSNTTRIILADHSPATFLPSTLKREQLILLSNSSNLIEVLKLYANPAVQCKGCYTHTSNGWTSNSSCVFPFIYSSDGQVYNECTWAGTEATALAVAPWCATAVNEARVYLSGAGTWGYCSPGCPGIGASPVNDPKLTDKGQSSLLVAVSNGNQTAVKLLLASNPEQLNQADKTGITPIHAVCRNKNAEMLQLLLQQVSVELNPREKAFNRTPLMECSQNGNLVGTKALIAKGANLNLQDSVENTALINAARILSTSKALIEAGADMNIGNNWNNTVFIVVCSEVRSNLLASAKLLIDSGADIKKVNFAGANGFSYACLNNNLEIVQFMLENGYGDVASPDNDGQTPLYKAAAAGHDKVVKVLLENGIAQVDQDKHNGFTPLHIAAENGHGAVVTLLLARKANTELKSNLGDTAEELAVKKGFHEIAAEIKGKQSGTLNSSPSTIQI